MIGYGIAIAVVNLRNQHLRGGTTPENVLQLNGQNLQLNGDNLTLN